MRPDLVCTKVEVRLATSAKRPEVRAYVDVEINEGLLVRELKVIDPPDGHGPWVVYPDRPRDCRCGGCDLRIGRTDAFCRHCGLMQPPRAVREPGPLYGHIVRPVCPDARASIQRQVLAIYRKTLAKARAADADAGAA